MSQYLSSICLIGLFAAPLLSCVWSGHLPSATSASGQVAPLCLEGGDVLQMVCWDSVIFKGHISVKLLFMCVDLQNVCFDSDRREETTGSVTECISGVHEQSQLDLVAGQSCFRPLSQTSAKVALFQRWLCKCIISFPCQGIAFLAPALMCAM